MATIRQLVLKKIIVRRTESRCPRLHKRPQLRGIVVKPRIATPKKPNSARRPVAKVVMSNSEHIVAHIPGRKHNIRKHSEVLIRGGGTRDLPGVNYTCIRGRFDLSPVRDKSRRRSIYGIKMDPGKRKRLRRRFRLI